MTETTQLRTPTDSAAGALRQLDQTSNMTNHMGLLEFLPGGKFEDYNQHALNRARNQAQTAQAVANRLATSILILRGKVDPESIKGHFNGTS